jgi:hypothetical protein
MMKKALVILLLAAPTLVFAQDRTKVEDTRGGREQQRTQMERGGATPGQRGGMTGAQQGRPLPVDIHVEFILTDQGGRPQIRMSKESNVRGLLDQPAIQEELTDMSGRVFSTVTEMFNFTGALGWTFKTQYVLESRGQRTTHFILSKGVNVDPSAITGRKPAASREVGAVGKDAGGRGTGAPERGEAPQRK